MRLKSLSDKAYKRCNSWFGSAAGALRVLLWEKKYFDAGLLNNKSVAVVCPSSSLDKKNYGDEIDKHDVVIKFNRMIDFPQRLNKDYGGRCDVLFHGLVPGEKPGYCGIINAAEWVKRNENVQVVYPFVARRNAYSVIGKFLRSYHGREILRILDKEVHRKTYRAINGRPTSGFVALAICVASGAKRISLFGMDSFKMQHTQEYFGGEIGPLDAEKFGHDPTGESAAVNQLARHDARIIMKP